MHMATKAYNSYNTLATFIHLRTLCSPAILLTSALRATTTLFRFNTEFSKAFKPAITAATSTPSPALTSFHMKKLHSRCPDHAEEHNIGMNPRSDLKMPKWTSKKCK